jgi:RNA polymerase sigma factor (sigma-70 family)
VAHQLLSVVGRLKQLFDPAHPEDADGALLDAFIARHDQAAFEKLLRRHGPRVLAVCRRVIGQDAGADDAFQVTFLTLACKARSLRNRQSVGAWLYRVAYQVALRAKTNEKRRRHVEGKAMQPERSTSDTAVDGREVVEIIDAELAALPEEYRAVLLLCGVEGRTHEEAAGILGWPVGSLSKRLARGRELLRRRLTQRGVTLSAAGLVALGSAAQAGVPDALLQATVRDALPVAIERTTAHLSAAVAELLRQTLHAMSWTTPRLAAIALGVGLAACIGVALVFAGSDAGEQKGKPPEPAQTERKEPPPPAKQADVPAMLRIGSLAWRFPAAVTNLAYSADGKWLVISDGMHVRVLDPATGSEIRTFKAQDNWIRTLALAPNGQIAVAGSEPKIHLWDASTGKPMRSFPHGLNQVFYLCCSADGKVLAGLGEEVRNAKDDDKGRPGFVVRVWNADTGKPHPAFAECNDAARTVALGPDGKTLAWAGWNGGLHVVNVADGKERFGRKPPESYETLAPERQGVPLAFAPDGKALAYGGSGDALVLLDAGDGSAIRKLPRQTLTGKKEAFWTVQFTPDGKALAALGADYSFALWDVKTGQETHRFANFALVNHTLAPDGKTIAGVYNAGPGLDQDIRLFDVAAGKVRVNPGQHGSVSRVAISPDGKIIATAAAEFRIRLWDRATGKERGRIDLDSFANAIAFTPDGATLVAVAGKATLWDVPTLKLKKEFPYPEAGGTRIAISPNADAVVYAGGRGEMIVQSLATGKLEHMLGNNKAWIMSLTFSPDGKKLIAGTGDRIDDSNKPPVSRDMAHYVWDLTTRKQIRRIEGSDCYINHVAVSRDGRYLISSAGTFEFAPSTVWDADGKAPKAFTGAGGAITALAASPDGKWFASASDKVFLFETKSWKMVREFDGHMGRILSLAFSADGRTLVSGSADGTAIVRDLSKEVP